MTSRQEIVVYKHSSTGAHPDVTIMTKEQLDAALMSDRILRVARKPIPRGHRHVEILQADLYPEPQRTQYMDAGYPNMRSSIATVTLPNRVWMQRQLTATQFDELYILSA